MMWRRSPGPKGAIEDDCGKTREDRELLSAENSMAYGRERLHPKIAAKPSQEREACLGTVVAPLMCYDNYRSHENDS